MRVPRVRFTVRRMMVAVAVVGVALWGADVWQKSLLYQSLARHHAQRAASYAGLAKQAAAIIRATRDGTRPVRPMVLDASDSPAALDAKIRRLIHIEVSAAQKNADFQRASAAYHSRMSRKYHRAASHPWLSIDPDPPSP